jgi:hypothetical protein
MAPHVGIVRPKRPRFKVSLGVAPPPVDMCSKMMPSRGARRRAPPSFDPRSPDLGFPLVQPESNDESNIDDAFMKETISKDGVIISQNRH